MTRTAAERPPALPRHVAIIMDGNGRWATARHLPRVAGHNRGVDAVRRVMEACGRRGIEYLTLFAFSSENWRRPADEVSTLMRLFMTALQKEVTRLHENGVRLRIAGDRTSLDPLLQQRIEDAEGRTAGNSRLHLTICASYGGRWDMVHAMQRMLAVDPTLAAIMADETAEPEATEAAEDATPEAEATETAEDAAPEAEATEAAAATESTAGDEPASGDIRALPRCDCHVHRRTSKQMIRLGASCGAS